ncbi:MAG: hypothetical protein IKI49_03365 [Oscillospiraceae bacterium]|nr:hypothetical protein [Oscillospiraceae bacterium]
MKNWYFSRVGDAFENWPKDENGEPVEPVFLEHLSGAEFDMETSVNLLRAYGIPIITAYPGNSSWGTFVSGYSANEADIYVPKTMLEEARDILAAETDGEENQDIERTEQ